MRLFSRKACREVEKNLRNYRGLKDAVTEEQNDILFAADYSVKNTWGVRTVSVTEKKVIKLQGEKTQARLWFEVVRKTRARFSGMEHGEVMKAYFDQGKSPEKTSIDLHMSLEKFYRIRKEVIYYACILALEKRLIKL